MQNFDIVKTTKTKKTFRNEYVIGKFDIQSDSVVERFNGKIDFGNDWKIGLIVGSSGSGKSTIARELFSNYIVKPDFGVESVFQEMPKHSTCEQISRAFTSCGFSSPPSWLKPYSVLSNGEKMRVELAYCILSKQKNILFDEFTSVVDRTIAKTTSVAINKAINRTQKRFIAVSCHDDIQEWLEPDWVFRTDSMTQIVKKKNVLNSDARFSNTHKNNFGTFLNDFTI